DGRDARAPGYIMRIAVYRCMPDAHTGNIGNCIERPGRQITGSHAKISYTRHFVLLTSILFYVKSGCACVYSGEDAFRALAYLPYNIACLVAIVFFFRYISQCKPIYLIL